MARLSEKIGYGFGDMSSSMFWKIFSYYLPIFYTNVFGLTAYDAMILLGVTKLYDAVSDPVMGIIADRTHTRWGRYRPYLLWMAIPFGIIGTLSFYTPDWGYTAKVVYAYVMYLLMMSVYTGVNVPYGAMLGVVSPSSREKSVFSSFRMFFAYIGSFVAMGIFGIFEKQVGGDVAKASPSEWTTYVGLIAVACVILFLACFAMTREHVKTETRKGDATGGHGVLEDLKHLVANGPWWLLLGGAVGLLLFGAMRGGATAYYFSYILGTNVLFTCAIFLLLGEISQMVGVVLTVPVSERIGKKTTFIVSLVLLSVVSACVWFVEPTTSGFVVLVVLQVLICIGIGLVAPLLWSMFADVADASELKHGHSSVGLIFSSSSMAQKFGATIGSMMLMGVLAIVGFDDNPTSEESLTGIRALMSWIPAIGTLLGLIAIAYYPLDTKRMKEIDAKLKVMRAEAEQK